MSPADPPISQQQLGAGIQHEIGQLAITQWLGGWLYPDLPIPSTFGNTPRGSVACGATDQQRARKARVARMPRHQSNSPGDHAPAPSVRVCPITDLGTLRIPPRPFRLIEPKHRSSLGSVMHHATPTPRAASSAMLSRYATALLCRYGLGIEASQ